MKEGKKNMLIWFITFHLDGSLRLRSLAHTIALQCQYGIWLRNRIRPVSLLLSSIIFLS